MQRMLKQVTHGFFKQIFDVKITRNAKQNLITSPQQLALQTLHHRRIHLSRMLGLSFGKNARGLDSAAGNYWKGVYVTLDYTSFLWTKWISFHKKVRDLWLILPLPLFSMRRASITSLLCSIECLFTIFDIGWHREHKERCVLIGRSLPSESLYSQTSSILTSRS